MPTDEPGRGTRRRTGAALAADLAGVLLFVAVGRRNHAEGLSITGIAETAWPFLTGTLVGWLASRGWRRPTSLVPTGVVVWLCTVAVGMALRKATGTGIAFSFITVATLVTALLILGWRAGLAVGARRKSG
jgi:peptidoglycan/LPS O-acetylase OafA/YrhL